ncbi:MAG TPA: nucleotide exchange factor GrpE [Pyrinomonadaceae bacterium]|nr:nucleotide exchange factor GrpE [Pyrinomonadaceae bacterium]
MNQTDMADKERQPPNRIPVRFVGDEGEGGGERPDGSAGGELTPEELGRASIYEDAGEMARRIDRGGEDDTAAGRERADDADVAGTIDYNELNESREDRDTTPPQSGEDPAAGGDADAEAGERQRQAGAADGPLMAELLATRAELRRVEAGLKKAADERQELLDKLARRQADFDNFRKRTERERKDTYNNALGDVVARLLPVVDNLQRALDTERTREAAGSAELSHFLRGVELIGKQLDGVLEALGVEAVPAVGHPFDPHVHEAVATAETDRFEADTVMEEMRRGYRLGDKLLRPAMVKVAKQ